MTPLACRAPLRTSELLDYWLGDADTPREAAIEEHLFECRACAAALQRLVALGDALRALVRRGEAAAIMPPAFVARLKAAGLVVREYRLRPSEGVVCTIAPGDDLVLARLEVPLAGVERLDVLIDEVEAGRRYRLDDVGFDPSAGEVVLVPNASELRGLDRATQRVELVAVSDAGDRVLGEYVFNHSRWRG